MNDKKYVYDFNEGNAQMRSLLGGKGANLAEMSNLGLPVPPGFTITTEACNDYVQLGEVYPEGLTDEVREHLARLEQNMGKKLGDSGDPLLVSVRSGAAFSMPGMMDTILNLGLNDDSVQGLIKQTNNERFAYDSYRRFVQMFGNVVLEVEKDLFERALTKMKQERGVKLDTELTAEDLKGLVREFKGVVAAQTGKEFPEVPWGQLDMAIRAVFRSWNNPRAKVYRRLNNIPDNLGTAVNVQTMVFGNKGDDCATGVAFTRDPSTGENVIYGEYLTNAQGEDVVAGIRTPQPISKLATEMPAAYEQLVATMRKLEEHYREMQDIEFTIEKSKLWMLQCRTGKRTAAAALKIAVDMVDEGLISKDEAVLRIDPDQLDQLLHPQLDPKAEFKVLAKGLPASPGAATGKVVFDADTAEEMGNSGEKVILTRWETTPDDIHGVVAAQGILTAHGGMTSHAAVVARGMGKPCVSGAEAIKIDMENLEFAVDSTIVKEGDIITIDGASGRVILGQVPLIPPAVSKDFQKILALADERRRLGVRTNADTPEDAARAREFGAEGIGLCRTEHMFMAEDRIPHVRDMILAETEGERSAALDNLLPVQRGDFEGIFKAMDGLPVTIRLLDPPLHEFLPSLADVRVELERLRLTNASADEIAKQERLFAKVRAQAEANPMLGLRGCRLGIRYPEIYMMQVKAITEAACNVKKQGVNPVVEIMIPLVAVYKELEILRAQTIEIVDETLATCGEQIPYKIGTMIELPRAALTADEVAEHADFFSFGTNDLTQTTYGFSRDDAEGKFLPQYLEQHILDDNPFEVLDTRGVGKLIEMACKLGRETKPDIKLGVCGEHGGEPRSIAFCHQVGLTYVSCSPFRVPVARLAAAQAALGGTTRDK